MQITSTTWEDADLETSSPYVRYKREGWGATVVVRIADKHFSFDVIPETRVELFNEREFDAPFDYVTDLVISGMYHEIGRSTAEIEAEMWPAYLGISEAVKEVIASLPPTPPEPAVVNIFTSASNRSLVELACQELEETAREAGDKAAANAFNKAALDLAHGIMPVFSHGDLLVPSATRAGLVHRVSPTRGCRCEAAIKGGKICRHAALLEATERAFPWVKPAPAVDDDQAGGDDQTPEEDWRSDAPSLVLAQSGTCRVCCAWLTDDELPSGLCDKHQPKRPPAAAAVAVPMPRSRVLEVSAAGQRIANELLAA